MDVTNAQLDALRQREGLPLGPGGAHCSVCRGACVAAIWCRYCYGSCTNYQPGFTTYEIHDGTRRRSVSYAEFLAFLGGAKDEHGHTGGERLQPRAQERAVLEAAIVAGIERSDIPTDILGFPVPDWRERLGP